MKGRFLAFSQQDIEEMKQDNNLILTFNDDEKYKFFADIEDAWDIIPEMFDDIFSKETNIYIEELPLSGCNLFSTDNVKQATKGLSKWTHESVLKAFQDIKKGIIFDSFKKDDGEVRLLEQFDTMVVFFQDAHNQGLGCVFIVE
jgi:hypothetical protein